MPVDKLSTVPRVLKSNETLDEINEKAQERLYRRRLSDLRKHNFLFGADKVEKHPHRRVVMTIKHDSTPHYK